MSNEIEERIPIEDLKTANILISCLNENEIELGDAVFSMLMIVCGLYKNQKISKESLIRHLDITWESITRKEKS